MMKNMFILIKVRLSRNITNYIIYNNASQEIRTDKSLLQNHQVQKKQWTNRRGCSKSDTQQP